MSGAARDLLAEVDALLADDDAATARAYPGDATTRQPVHTCYVSADRADRTTPSLWGAEARAVLDANAGDVDALARLLADIGVPLAPADAEEVLTRVRRVLRERPVQDLRIDLEDGYGLRPDAEEDAHAAAAGRTLAAWRDDAGAPFVAGVRVKGLQPATRARALRSLDRLVGAAADTGGLPHRTVVTWPKVASPAHVEAAVLVVERLEVAHGLPAGALRLELQVELPQAVVAADGSATVARLVHAGAGRVEGLHYGTYDFSAALGVGPADQSLDHPLADHAKAVMQLAAAQTGVRVSDGSTNVLPVGTPEQVRDALVLHGRLVRRAHARALRQGWDLHPGQLVTRYAVTVALARAELAATAARLRAYAAGAAAGTLDEPATARALAGALLRGIDDGALDGDEVRVATGLDDATLLDFAGRTP
ncbi:DUF6986 family protein [Aquipuribacter nitratireducens]|uniref:DUF6986 family protein n=1 Tax=Aquipuribacter nitratireducens TaxID=650104 RepID=A0ABW0GTN7_9MICO